MATMKERLVEWLRDAHAAEEQAETMFKGTANRIEHYPEFKQRLAEQAEVSARHAEQLKECLSDLDESPSMVKQLTGKVTAIGQTLSGMLVGDEVMKAALATETFAQMEIASYRILVAAAEAAGEPEVRQMCETLLDDEVEFADWLDQQLPSLTVQYLSREAAGTTSTH